MSGIVVVCTILPSLLSTTPPASDERLRGVSHVRPRLCKTHDTIGEGHLKMSLLLLLSSLEVQLSTMRLIPIPTPMDLPRANQAMTTCLSWTSRHRSSVTHRAFDVRGCRPISACRDDQRAWRRRGTKIELERPEGCHLAVTRQAAEVYLC